MLIRQAVVTDLQRLKRDAKAAVGRSFELELEEQANGIHSLFIAGEDDDIVGWGFIRWHGPRDPDAKRRFPGAPELYRLEVREALRSCGIGQALIADMASAAADRGFAQVSLGVAHANPRAYALYKRLGFEDTALDQYIDEYRYPLDGGGFGVARDVCRFMVKRL